MERSGKMHLFDRICEEEGREKSRPVIGSVKKKGASRCKSVGLEDGKM